MKRESSKSIKKADFENYSLQPSLERGGDWGGGPGGGSVAEIELVGSFTKLLNPITPKAPRPGVVCEENK